jgi:hypothetical protein
MIRIFREDTQWAIAGNVETAVLEEIVCQLPKDLQGDGSRIVTGNDGFAALLVFGDLPNETLAKRLLATVTPVYLLDFDDDAPVTLKLDRRKRRVTETRVDEHPSSFLKEHGIVAPGYALTSTPVREVGIIEGISVGEAKRALPSEADDVELRQHPRGVLIDNAIIGGMLAEELGKRGFLVFRDPEDKDGWFYCVVHEPGKKPASYSPVRPDLNSPALDNILGETTLEGILRVLEIPGEFLGL